MGPEESALYGLPLDEFVPRRTELEKRLRKEGERERAAAVKKLPKPSVAAWAVNQASRCRPKERKALLAASAELRDVQERLLSGDASAADLERATTAQREAIDGLVEAAAGLLTSEGKSMGDATLARVRETFAAVATDDELADLVEAGVLDRERQATGLGFPFAAAEPSGGRKGGGSAKAGSAKAGSAKAGAKARGSAKAGGSAKPGTKARGSASAEHEAAERAQRQEDARRARERAKAAKQAEREAAKRLEAAERAAAKAAEDLERRERRLGEARERAEAAREELEAAREEHSAAASAREEAEAGAGG